MTDPRDRLDEWQRLAEQATPGPWKRHAFGHAGEDEPSSIVIHSGEFDWAEINAGGGVAGLIWEYQSDLDAEFIAASRTAVPALVAAVRAVLDLHQPFGIFDECDCEDASLEDGKHKLVEDVGITCDRMYNVCRECCCDDVYQREDCANYHDHNILGWQCPTVEAITDALGGGRDE